MVLHTLYQKSVVEIGDNVSVGHNATIHETKICDNVLVGMGLRCSMAQWLARIPLLPPMRWWRVEPSVEPGSLYAGVPANRSRRCRPSRWRILSARPPITTTYIPPGLRRKRSKVRNCLFTILWASAASCRHSSEIGNRGRERSRKSVSSPLPQRQPPAASVCLWLVKVSDHRFHNLELIAWGDDDLRGGLECWQMVAVQIVQNVLQWLFHADVIIFFIGHPLWHRQLVGLSVRVLMQRVCRSSRGSPWYGQKWCQPATMRPRCSLMFTMAERLTDMTSSASACHSMVSDLTGWKVPAPHAASLLRTRYGALSASGTPPRWNANPSRGCHRAFILE